MQKSETNCLENIEVLTLLTGRGRRDFYNILGDDRLKQELSIGRAGHNFRCPLLSPLSVDPLINGTALIFSFENVNLTEERLFLNLFMLSALRILFCRFLANSTLSTLLFFL
jgi:hypothetical protein